MQLLLVAECSVCLRRYIFKCVGGIGSINAGMSSAELMFFFLIINTVRLRVPLWRWSLMG